MGFQFHTHTLNTDQIDHILFQQSEVRTDFDVRGFYAEDRLYPFFKYDYMLKVYLHMHEAPEVVKVQRASWNGTRDTIPIAPWVEVWKSLTVKELFSILCLAEVYYAFCYFRTGILMASNIIMHAYPPI